ncbi:MAG: prolipoprotein diacylglyceryl transferase [Blastocatellia bacterium]
MFPELFKLPYTNFTFNTYGLLLAISFIVGLFVMAKLAEHDGLDRQKVYDLGLWVLAASLVGSKLLLVVTEWDSNAGDNWRRLFSFDFLLSAGVFYGGFIAAVIASVIVMRRYKLPWWRTADAFAPGIAIGQAIGRLGCFSAGCCWGKPTTAWCGVHFSEKGHEYTQVPTVVAHLADPIQQNVWSERLGGLLAPIKLHPTQLYESAVMVVVFAILLVMFRRRRFHGQVILAYAILYAVARFVIELWRDDPRGEVWGLSTSQFIAVILFIGAILAFIYRSRTADRGLRIAATAK